LSIIATINTSDESIYYLDSAFKRRWDWQFIRSPSGTFYIENENIPLELKAEVLSTMLTSNNEEKYDWKYCVIGINEFIKLNYQSIRRIEDKQIGWWFIKPENGKIELQQVKDKLMFYLWDSVFTRDKKALEDFLSDGGKMYKLRQYSDFLDLTEDFMDKIYQLGKNIYVNNNY
jgi:hypothetical protein